MQREPNPYAQQSTYTVTQTMAISVPSAVAEDVLDGEDGGMNEVDNAAMQELQSDMVELKSDVADLSSQLNTVNDDVQQLTSQCIELKETTVAANYKGNAKGDLTLTINGSNGSLYLSAKDAYNSITQLDRYALQVALADLYDEDARYTFVNGVLSKSTNEGVSWDPISSSSSGSNNQALSINGLDALSFSCNYDTRGTIVVQGSTTDASGLAYYPLATSSFANVDTIACRMKPVSNGIAYSNDYGNTWTTITATSGSDSGSSSNIELKDPLSSLQVTGLSDYTLLLQAAYKDDPSALGYCTLVVNGIANVDNSTCRLRVTSSGTIQTSTNAGSTWTTITSSESLVLAGALNKVYMNAETHSDYTQTVIELAASVGSTSSTSQQYALAVPAIANSASPSVQMRPTSSGIETSLDYGKTWKLLSASSGDSAGSGSNSGSGVYFSNSYDSVFTSAYINYNGANASISLNGPNHGSGQLYPLCNALADMAHPSQYGTQLALYNGAICLGDSNEWRQISSADLSDAESLSMSNMIWLSDNASKLAALLNS